MRRLATFIAATAIMVIAVGTGSASAQLVGQDQNAHSGLAHVGPNPFGCGGSWSGTDGSANVHVNSTRGTSSINVSIHGALPNATYYVNVRCRAILGGSTFTTNAQGTGTVRFDVSGAQAGLLNSPFVLEVGHQGPGGWAGWDDMFLASISLN